MTSNARLIEMTASEPLSFFAQFGPGVTPLKFRRRERLFSQDTPADCLFFIKEGRVKLTVVSPQGREATLALLGPGDFLGEECMLRKQAPRMSTAIAMQESVAVRLDRKLLQETMQRDPKSASFLMAHLVTRNLRLQEDLIDHLCHSSEQRLARILLLLAGFRESDAAEAVVPKISQEVLAEMVGTTRSRVSYFMNRFRKKGHIDYNGQFQIRRSLASILTNGHE